MTAPTPPPLVTTRGPHPTDVAALTELLDLMVDFPSNEQRARYLLTCNWMRDRGAAAAELNRRDLAAITARTEASQ